jgi:hypothetical protein
MDDVSRTRPWPLGVLAAFLMFFGCASDPASLDPAFQYPALGKSQRSRSFNSSLVVYTETWIDLNLGSGDDGSVRRPTGYTLFDDHGRRLRYVRNYIGALDSEPTLLDVDPGRYLILLDKPGKNPPIFWVEVEPEKLTEVTFR